MLIDLIVAPDLIENVQRFSFDRAQSSSEKESFPIDYEYCNESVPVFSLARGGGVFDEGLFFSFLIAQNTLINCRRC